MAYRQPTKRRKASREEPVFLGGFSGKAFREHLRGYNQQGKGRLEVAIGVMREKIHASRYEEAIRALLLVAPTRLRELFPTGQVSYGALFWGQPFPAVPLDDELHWTSLWLQVRSGQLSQFRGYADRIQALLGRDAFEEALSQIAELRKRLGYSFWLVELETAVIQYFKGTAEQRAFTASLRKDAPANSVAAFLAYVFGDRNDETQTHDAFYTRTSERLPQVDVDGWLNSFLLYRVLQHYDPSPDTIALNLRNERLSSIPDLYETFIESALTISTTFALKAHRPALVRALDALADVKDPRIARIRMLAGGGLPPKVEVSNDGGVTEAQPSDDAWEAVEGLALWREREGHDIAGKLQTEAYEALSEVWEAGSRAEKAVGKALKLGLNFKSLDVGVAIAGQADKQSSKTERTLLFAPGALVLRRQTGWEEIVGGPFDLSMALLAEYVSRLDDTNHISAKLLNAASTAPSTFEDTPALGRLWLVNVYDFKGDYGSAARVMDSLVALGGRWSREATRSRFVVAYSRGDLATACQVLTTAVVNEHEFNAELPVTEMFWGRKWKDFAKLDPIQVGIASFLAFDAPATSPVKHICSSACRLVMRSGLRAMIESPVPSDMPKSRRNEIVFFFATVWAEDALGRTGLFESSQEVRLERIKVMQNLLSWDTDNVDTYVAVIKQLTVNETLWRGLKHLNETRVFVNEAAITRWAEKELAEEYGRWKVLVGAEGTGEVFTEEKFLQYLAAPVDSHSGIQDVNSVTESDAVLIPMVNRLLVKFLTDPTDGLNCYLSLRVRHGTMTGTLSGPSESADLLVPLDEPKEESLARLVQAYGADPSTIELVYSALSNFTKRHVALGDDLVKERVQVFGHAKPNGLLYAALDYNRLGPAFSSVAQIHLLYFVYVCYNFFWSGLRRSLDGARDYFKETVQAQIQEMFSELLEELQPVATELPALLTAVQTAATLSAAQCDVVAGWFQLPNHRDAVQQVFKIDQAIEIARQATTNVYPGFDPEVRVTLECGELPLSGIGLSAIADCLFVMLQNVSNRSGLAPAPWVTVHAAKQGEDIFVLRVENPISDAVRDGLKGGRMALLKNRYSAPEETAKLVDQEGGSGLPKLWRMTRSIDASLDAKPLSFGLTDDDLWYVEVKLRLVVQDGVYHAS